MKKILVLLGVMVLLFGCSVKTNVNSAKEFVENYSKAYQYKDAKAIFAMQAKPDAVEGVTPPSVEEQVAEIKKELDEGGMWVESWSKTKYVSEDKRDGYIIVKVRIKMIPSEIVLVEQGGALRLHPEPSKFPR